ncbi:RagB/SusD family nutrient uptake outer membrane protein [Arenibacter aquaticus]|uniref:RagB/SusD family nutrient uptake outer membrane protein n=1 Tax=Arenibacter aquaticus TaxID=2489054 RepID=A0A3S0IQL7_9FLAO|nr:RagB/SusD family nutrient uptake outer membrane protein [Arenibacter aquaticus]RTE55383.1 RagB/SusD family nutrient uptake outer membrane protein [Arenibacter aquaticus]
MKDKIYKLRRNNIVRATIAFVFIALIASCDDSILEENPLSEVSLDVLFSNEAGFDNYIVSLHEAARQEHTRYNRVAWHASQWTGTDVGIAGSSFETQWEEYGTYLTPTRDIVVDTWSWCYRILLIRANTIITYAEKPESANLFESEAEKNAIVAEAKFFRAYGHNLLANLYGGIPIMDTLNLVPKNDFTRNTRKEVYEHCKKDLEFASQWLPETVSGDKDGRIVKAAADHLLTEIYISLGEYDNAITSASRVIDSGLYELMTERFGVNMDQPGDVFSDLFIQGNQNRSSGNKESIYVWQFEDGIAGGGENLLHRIWGPFYIRLSDPDGVSGMILADSLSRGVAFTRPTNYVLYDIWKDNWDNDLRNSEYNIKRKYWYNNPNSNYYGQLVEERTEAVDTLQNIYPTIRKIEGERLSTASQPNGRSAKDMIVYRLAETYLLRAEAYLNKGDKINAAEDINMVRSRSNAKPVSSSDVTIDYILDERARELIAEEPRRRTLVRMGKLVERVRKYSDFESSRTSIQDYHELWPIPQVEIDANFGAELEQNPGY